VVTQIDGVVRLVRVVLGDGAVGIYLHGSTARDAMRPHSDLDVLVVSAERLTDAERRSLVDGILPISGRWGDAVVRPIELTVVAQPEVRPWRYAPRMELQYGEWLRRQFDAGEIDEPIPNADLAILLTMVLQANRPVFGPPPAELLDPVPNADLRRAMLDAVPGMLADFPEDTTNYLLTLARTWVSLTTGAIVGKDEAAAWALERLPVELRPPMARALAAYLGDADYGGWAGSGLAAARATAEAIVAHFESFRLHALRLHV
jgi:streptomycin 3"-adenylyltransferase